MPTDMEHVHVFARGGHESKAILVSAPSELVAKGLIHESKHRWGTFHYHGTLSEVLEENLTDEVCRQVNLGVIDLNYLHTEDDDGD